MIPYAGWYIATGVGMVKEFTDKEFNAHDMLATSGSGIIQADANGTLSKCADLTALGI